MCYLSSICGLQASGKVFVCCSLGAIELAAVVAVWSSVCFLSVWSFYLLQHVLKNKNKKDKNAGNVILRNKTWFSWFKGGKKKKAKKKAFPLSEENFSALLNWICQTGMSPGIAVWSPAPLVSSIQSCREVKENAEKMLCELGSQHWAASLTWQWQWVISSFWVSLGCLGSCPMRKRELQGFSPSWRAVLVLGATLPGACASCSPECIWSDASLHGEGKPRSIRGSQECSQSVS